MADDPRVIPARPDLAALHLKDVVEADVYASPTPMRVSVPLAPMTATRDAEGEMISQLIFGESFTAYENENGWVWGQTALDGYVGFIPEACLMEAHGEATHRITAVQALVYPDPDFRARPIGALPFGARVSTGERSAPFVELDVGGWVGETTVKPIADKAPMWVATAERFKGAPYLWGGRSAAGFDCSGLVQVALHSANVACPRDSDQQMAALGRDAPQASLRRGDLVFWKGHVGIMTSPEKILHANLHHMEVAEEPFATAVDRIGKKEFGDILGVKRITA